MILWTHTFREPGRASDQHLRNLCVSWPHENVSVVVIRKTWTISRRFLSNRDIKLATAFANSLILHHLECLGGSQCFVSPRRVTLVAFRHSPDEHGAHVLRSASCCQARARKPQHQWGGSPAAHCYPHETFGLTRLNQVSWHASVPTRLITANANDLMNKHIPQTCVAKSFLPNGFFHFRVQRKV